MIAYMCDLNLPSLKNINCNYNNTSYLQSQQDLSFADLDPEKLSKPQPSKGLAKTRTSPDEEQPTAPNEFTYNAEPSIWETEKYKDWKSNVNNFVLPETKENYIGDSGTQGNVRDSCISDELQPSVGDGDLTESSETSQMTPHPPKRRHKKSLTKSPVATRLKLSSSFSKRRQEGEEEELVTNELSMKDFPKAHKDLESNVFDNPIMNIREQSLVDEETESTSSTTSSPSRKPLLREPLSQVMERADRQQTDMFDVKQTLDLTDDTAGLLEVTEFHGSVLSGTDHRHTLSEETTDDYRQVRLVFGYLIPWKHSSGETFAP